MFAEQTVASCGVIYPLPWTFSTCKFMACHCVLTQAFAFCSAFPQADDRRRSFSDHRLPHPSFRFSDRRPLRFVSTSIRSPNLSPRLQLFCNLLLRLGFLHPYYSSDMTSHGQRSLSLHIAGVCATGIATGCIRSAAASALSLIHI